jgi:hypothetical protein
MIPENERKRLFRYANIAILVGAIILFGGVLLFHDAGEGAMQLVALVGFFFPFVVLHGLDERAKKRDRRNQ